MKSTCLLSLTPFAAPSAQAQNDISWVASYGSDSNPCTQASPCRDFITAFGATKTGGIVKALDAADFGYVNELFRGGHDRRGILHRRNKSVQTNTSQVRNVNR
jgi:hypothetical protein